MDKMKKFRLLHTLGYVCIILILSVASVATYASGIVPPPTPLGGPGSLFLLAVGAAIGVVVAIRNKWKK